MAQKWFTHEVPVGKVKPSLHPRTFKESGIADFAKSIGRVLMHPIVVTDDYQLIAGQRRLLAAKRLGWRTIPARVVDLDNGEAELATLDENLEREELTEVERVKALARRKELYEVIHPETKHGGAPGLPGGGKAKVARTATFDNRQDAQYRKPEGTATFATDTAAKTGLSERTIRQDVAIGKALDPQAAADVSDIPEVADSKKELAALAKLPQKEQRQVAGKVKAGKAKKVTEAIAGAGKQPEGIEERIKAANAPLESLARRIGDIIKEVEASDNPHLIHERAGRAVTAVAQLKSAASTIRAAKVVGECPYCKGKPRKPTEMECRACYGTGWVGKITMESAPQK